MNALIIEKLTGYNAGYKGLLFELPLLKMLLGELRMPETLAFSFVTYDSGEE